MELGGSSSDEIDILEQEILQEWKVYASTATLDLEVSSIKTDRCTGNQILRTRNKFGNGFDSISSLSPFFEPLSYPLLFCHGIGNGWTSDLKLNQNPKYRISYFDYLVSRFLMPLVISKCNEDEWDGAADAFDVNVPMGASPRRVYAFTVDDPEGGEARVFPTNPFEAFARLGGTWLVDNMSRGIDYQLNFLQMNQNAIFGRSTFDHRARGGEEGVDDGHDEGNDEGDRDDGGNSEGQAGGAGGGHDDDDNDNDNHDHGDEDEDDDDYMAGRTRGEGHHDEDDEDENDRNQRANRYGMEGNADEFVTGLYGSQRYDPKSKKTFCSDSIHGSDRALKKRATNALEILAQLGPPTFFLTVTTNTNWPEFKERLPTGYTAYECPAITNLIFKARLDVLLQNLRSGAYFGGKKCAYIIRCIEYQERGLPHCHIVFRLEGFKEQVDEMLASCNKLYEEKLAKVKETGEQDESFDEFGNHIDGKPVFDRDGCVILKPDRPLAVGLVVDTYISACVPSADNAKLCDTVSKFNKHVCRPPHLVNSCKNTPSGRCKSGFDDNKLSVLTTFDKNGFPQYKRLNEEDLNIVSYNEQITLNWDGHANLTYSGSTFCVLYLYNYLFKGKKKIKMGFAAGGVVPSAGSPARPLPPRPDDEIGNYFMARRLCVNDALWRALGFQTYPSTTPVVKPIKVRMPEFVTNFSKSKKYCDVEIYFLRKSHPALWLLSEAATYQEFFKQFVYSFDKPTKAFIRSNEPYFEIKDPTNNKRRSLFIKKRAKNDVIVRLATVPFKSGEPWYLRLILKNRAVESFKDCRCQWDNVAQDYYRDADGNAVVHKTFQTAAVQNLYVEDGKNECLTVFKTSIEEDHEKPSALRVLFVTLTENGFPTLVIKEHDDGFLWRHMYPRQQGCNPNEPKLSKIDEDKLEQDLLTQLSDLFHAKNLTMEQYGLPVPRKANTQLQNYALRFNQTEQSSKLQSLRTLMPLNDEQAVVYDNIMDIIRRQQPQDPCKFVMLEGDGGTGKSVLLMHIVLTVRSE